MAPTPDLELSLRNALSHVGSASSDFDLNKDLPSPQGRVLKPAAVLIGITEQAEVILTKRSARLKHHPGQVAFPGGKQDPTDATLTDAALREAHEEIGLPPSLVRPLGALPNHETVTCYQVTPIVALIQGDFTEVPEAGEVAEQGHKRFYYAVPYGPYYIWGATARILRGLSDVLS